MALSILDGNQSATTLSTILSSGQHITAHTVVSLGTQAITDMRGAVSGSVVSISNTVTIAGTVTANPTGTQTIAGTVTANINTFPDATTLGEQIAQGFTNYGSFEVAVGGTSNISGTVTASALKLQTGDNVFNYLSGQEIQEYSSGNPVVAVYASLPNALPTGTNRIGVVTIGGGTVTIGAGTAQIGSVTVGNSVTIGSLPALAAGTAQIGVVTIGNIRRTGDGALSQLTTEVGSGALQTVIGAGTSQIGSVTASISNSVTIGSLPAISGTVTANLAISSTVITSGSFTSLTSATLVPANTARKMATVYNLGAGQLFVNAGATATTLGGGFMVALFSGDYFECDYTTTTLSAIFATAGTASWMSH